jgi:3-hydroxyacyl-[acyl-carrier-protein] dehydratase
MPSTFDTVANIISETCDIPRETIKPESHAINDLGIDSLDFLDIAFAIDKAFGIKMPLEQWTQEVNDGKATTEQYFQLNNLCTRIAELDLAQQTIRAEARVPAESTIFEGHFPGYPLMPGVLLIEAMAQTSGWLVIAVTNFTRMPFFAALKEAKLRTFITPGQNLSLSAKLLHEGSGYAVTKADIRCDGKLACNAEITFRLVEFPNPEFRASMEKMAAILEFPRGAPAHG